MLLASVSPPYGRQYRAGPQGPQRVAAIAVTQQGPGILPQSVPALVHHQPQAFAGAPIAEKLAFWCSAAATTDPFVGDRHVLGQIRRNRALASVHGARIIVHP